jgi:hypothetical protein
MEKWTFFTLPGLELPFPLIVQPVASRYTDWAIPARGGGRREKKTDNSVSSVLVKRSIHFLGFGKILCCGNLEKGGKETKFKLLTAGWSGWLLWWELSGPEIPWYEEDVMDVDSSFGSLYCAANIVNAVARILFSSYFNKMGHMFPHCSIIFGTASVV